MKKTDLLLLPGDGIGPEVIGWARRVLEVVADRCGLSLSFQNALIGGVAIDATGVPLPQETLAAARACDAILLGATGGPRWDNAEQRPEQGLLKLRQELDLFANLRPAKMYSELVAASSLKPELVAGLDMLIVRELTGGIYFGTPRSLQVLPSGERQAVDTQTYSESEISRIAKVAFQAAAGRSGRLCSVDKANVMESSRLWRAVVDEIAVDWPQVQLSHLLVDNAAMQLVAAPQQFDVIVTDNLFGDILSDISAMLTGSIGLLPSASLNASGQGMFEPCHGSAPDIAGTGKANPLAAILSGALLLRYSLHQEEAAAAIETAVKKVLASGLRTADIARGSEVPVSCAEMGRAVAAALELG